MSTAIRIVLPVTFVALTLGATSLWTLPASQSTNKDHYASETPDGGYLFYSYRHGKPDIFRRTPSGEDINLTNHREHFDILPKLHPSGTYFAFSSGPDMGTLAIQTLPLTGGTPQPLIGPTEGISYVHPSWSPDGAWISYNVNDMASETGAIFIARADGSDSHNVTADLVGGNGGSVWTPDSQWIVFSHQPGTGWESPGDLYAVHLETGMLSQLTQTDASSEIPTGFTPDGKTLLLTYKPTQGRHQVAQMTIEAVGHELRATPARPLLHANRQDYFASSLSHDGAEVIYSVGTWRSGFTIGRKRLD